MLTETATAPAPATAAPPEQVVREIPLDQLHDSPFQPRTEYDPAELANLAENIKAEGGVLQPVIARLHRTNPLRDDIHDGFELVFGHRRKRAAALAGLATLPVILRAMTDAQVRAAQMSENIQRENMRALEEGAAFKATMDADELSAAALAQRLGMSETYVLSRVKLLGLVPSVKQALHAGEIKTEVAILIARLRTEKLQDKALARIKAINAELGDGGRASFRKIRDELAECYTLNLKLALFKTDDALLIEAAGACTTCPKRTGNAPEFADLANDREGRWHGNTIKGDANICTDPDCFEAKKKQHLANLAAAMRDKGVEVVDGNKARQAVGADGKLKGDDFLPADEVRKLLKDKPAAAKTKLPEVVIQNPRDGKVVKAIKRADLEAAGLVKPQPKGAGQRDTEAQRAKRDEARREEERQKAQAESQRRKRLLHAVRTAAMERERDAFELRMVAAAALSGVGYHDQPVVAELHGYTGQNAAHQLKKAIDTMPVAQLTALLLDCAIVDHVRVEHYNMGTKPVPLLTLAEHYGIDIKAAMAEPAEAASTPSPAAQAKKSASPKGPKGVKYRDPESGATWTGRGLQPAWLKAKMAAGHSLTEYQIQKDEAPAPKAGARTPAEALQQAVEAHDA